MSKFRFISTMLLAASVLVMYSCSKSSSDDEKDQTETFQTINAKFYYLNGSSVPETVYTEVGATLQIYVGNGSTKDFFNGQVKWSSTGSGELALSAVQKSGVAKPATKAGYDYTTTSATTNAGYYLQIKPRSDGMTSLTAKDAAGNSKVLMFMIYPQDEE